MKEPPSITITVRRADYPSETQFVRACKRASAAVSDFHTFKHWRVEYEPGRHVYLGWCFERPEAGWRAGLDIAAAMRLARLEKGL